jgi:hypothetical protein
MMRRLWLHNWKVLVLFLLIVLMLILAPDDVTQFIYTEF